MSSGPRVPAQDVASEVLLDPATRDASVSARVDAWLELQQTLCWRPAEARRLLEACAGDPAAALRMLGGRERSERASGVRAALVRAAARLLPFGASTYPERLRALRDPPPLLAVRGDASLLARPAVAIVGARAATSYGRGVALELGAELARAGIVVVSGLARGVDAAAHRGALEVGGATVAILACGPDRVYPPEHRELARQIAAQGAVASELPPGAAPLPYHFPLRNRIISGLSLAVVVVEARPRSGSLITARHALDQGREVLAVPGSVKAPTSAGPNALLRDGARPVLDVRDVLEQIGWTRTGETPPQPVGPDPPAPSFRPAERRLLARLVDGPATRDELARTLAMPAAEVAAALVMLQLEAVVIEDRDGRLTLAPALATSIGPSGRGDRDR